MRDRAPFPFLETPFNEDFGQFSPDGHWVAYQSDESGQAEVYVASFPGPGDRTRISTAGGRWPRWGPEGKELFYLAADDTLMAASVNATSSTFEVATVEPLFDTRPTLLRSRYPYAVSSDGQRFLVNSAPEYALAPLTLVVNWAALLKE